MLAGEGTPIDDHRASAAYRSAMLGNVAAASSSRTSRATSLTARSCGHEHAVATGPTNAVVGAGAPARERGPARHRPRALHRRPRRRGPATSCTPSPSRRRTPTPGSPGCDAAPALDVPGVVRVLTADDVPGVNDAGVKHDEPLFPTEVMFHGHAVCWVLGETLEAARLGARGASRSTTSRCPSLVTVARGDRGRAASRAAGRRCAARRRRRRPRARGPRLQRRDRDRRPGALLPRDPRLARPWSTRAARSSCRAAPSTRPRPRRSSPTCSACASHEVTVQCLRMGGGFGGKEMQPHGLRRRRRARARRSPAARCGCASTARQDMTMTGKRHGFHASGGSGFDDDGRLAGARGDADLRRRLEPRPLRAGAGPGAVPRRQRLLDPARARPRPDRADPQDVADRVPRLRRPAGDARHRGHPRPLRPAARHRPGRAAPPQLLRRRPGHALRPAGAPRRAAAAAWEQVADVGRA